MKKKLMLFTTVVGMLLCGCSGTKTNEKIKWSSWYDNGDGTHSRHSLNDITIQETDHHHFSLYKTIQEATEVAPGKAVYSCDECSAKEEKIIAPTGNYVFDQKVVDDKYLYERRSEHTAIYYMSSKEGVYGNPEKLFEYSDIEDGYTEVSYISSDGRQYIDTGIENNSNYSVNINNTNSDRGISSDYDLVEYIQSTGEQYIDTGVKYNSNLSFEIDFSDFTSPATSFIFGIDNPMFGFARRLDNQLAFLSDSYKMFTNDNFSTDGRYNVKCSRSYFVCNGVSSTEQDDTENKEGDGTFRVFGGFYNKYPNTAFKLYSFKIYLNGTLLRDFVPVVRKVDNVAGLVDKVDGNFYTNKGTGSFITGNVIDGGYGNLPTGYQQVECIKANGTQYIDTGYKVNSEKLKIITSLSLTSDTAGLSLFGSNGGTYDLVPYSTGMNTFTHWIGSSANILPIAYNNDHNDVTYELDNGSITCTLNGNSTSGTYTGSIISGHNLYIFGKNESDSSKERGNGYNLYSFKMYDNDVLVRDYIPCYRIKDNIAGLYDLVGNSFYTNKGIGSFITGNIIDGGYSILPTGYQQVESIEANGTQYIDTEFVPNNNTGIEIKFSSKSYENDDLFVFGGGVESGNQAFELYPWDGKFEFNYGDSVIFLGNNPGAGAVVTAYQSQMGIGYQIDGGETYSGAHPSQTFAAPYSLTIGALHREETLISKNLTIYYCKIWDNNTLVRDYIPCIRTSDSKAGLFDLVTHQFFENKGSGIFNYGEIVDGNASRLPSDYQEVEYVRSTGQQYINLDLSFNPTDSCSQLVDIRFLNDEQTWCGSNWYLQYTYGNRYKINDHDRKSIYQEFEDATLTTYVNGSLISKENFSTKVGENCGYGVFRLMNPNQVWARSEMSSQMLYALKIYQNSNLVRDMVPCYRISDGEIGLYDLVSSRFFENESDTPLMKGREVTPYGDQDRNIVITEKHDVPDYYYQLNYVESTGFEFLDTGVVGNASIEMDVKFFENGTNQIMGYSDELGEFFGINNASTYIGTDIQTSGIDHIVCDIGDTNEEAGSIKINDNEPLEFTAHKIEDKTLKLFGISGEKSCNSLIYYAKISQDGVLVRDLVPVMERNTKAVGLYDLVGQHFYESMTPSSLVSGGMMFEGIDQNHLNVFCDRWNNQFKPTTSKIESYKVKDNMTGNLVRDYVPVIRNSDSKPGLYDLVSKEFFTSTSAYDFTYGELLNHILDNGTVIKKPTYNEDGEMVYKCSICGEEIHKTIPRTAFKITFVSEVNTTTAIKIFESEDPKKYQMSMVGYSRNVNTYNYSKYSAYIYFEIPDTSKEYEIIASSGTVVNLGNNKFMIKDIKSDVFVRIR